MTEFLMAFRLAPPTLLGLGQHVGSSRRESRQPREPRGGCRGQSAPEADCGHADMTHPTGGTAGTREGPAPGGREVLWSQRARLPAPAPPRPSAL